MSTHTFPQYRSLQSFNRHYKIVSDRLFIEATLRNGNWQFQEIQATQYPEMLRIQDMLNQEFSYTVSETDTVELFNQLEQ